MADQAAKETQPQKKHPTAETIRHYRHQINSRKEEVSEKIFKKSGTSPTERELINAAGKKLREEIESGVDPLTGLWNLVGFNKRKAEAVSLARSNNQEMTVAYIDLDGLKVANDTLGHDAGDELLVGTAEAIKSEIRITDVAARKGGDEFVVLLSDTGVEGGNAWKERLLLRFNDRGIKASIGLAPLDLNNPDASISNADANMISEKRRKKDQKNGIVEKIVSFVRRRAA